MEQLWATLPARGDQAQGSGTEEESAPKEAARVCHFSKAGAAKPPPSLAAPATSVVDTVPERASAGADIETPTAGSDKQCKSVVEFEPTKVVDLEDFLKEWKAELRAPLVDHFFNAEWPGGRLTANEKHLKNLAVAYVFTALATLGAKIDQGISPGRVLRQLAKPSVGFYVTAGERALGTNRQRQGGGRGGSIARRPIRIAVSLRVG